MDGISPDDAAEVFHNDTRPRPMPTQSKHLVPDNELPCASEDFESPRWLQEEYVPRYEHALPPYIKVPDVTTSTWK